MGRDAGITDATVLPALRSTVVSPRATGLGSRRLGTHASLAVLLLPMILRMHLWPGTGVFAPGGKSMDGVRTRFAYAGGRVWCRIFG